MQAIILCGGLSTRLGGITKEMPKVLLPIGGLTILEHQINLLKSANVTQIILASGHLHEVLFNKVGSQHKGVQVLYAKEDKRLGTGGAIKNAMKHIKSDPFFVLNGDVLVENVSLAQMLFFFQKIEISVGKQIDGLLLSTRVEDVSDFGQIISGENGRILDFREKQSEKQAGYINGGLYLFNQKIQKFFPSQDAFSIEHHVFLNVNQLYSFKKEEAKITDVGTPERLEYARQKYSSDS